MYEPGALVFFSLDAGGFLSGRVEEKKSTSRPRRARSGIEGMVFWSFFGFFSFSVSGEYLGRAAGSHEGLEEKWVEES